MYDQIDMTHQLWVGFWLGVGTTVFLEILAFCVGLALDV